MTDLTIQDVSRRSGLSEPTLRYYEEIGLIGPIARDPSSRHRRYREEEVDTLQVLARLRAMGIGIEEMRTYQANRELGQARAGEQRDLLLAPRRQRCGDPLAVSSACSSGSASVSLRWKSIDLRPSWSGQPSESPSLSTVSCEPSRTWSWTRGSQTAVSALLMLFVASSVTSYTLARLWETAIGGVLSLLVDGIDGNFARWFSPSRRAADTRSPS
jgi:DNA-binding transcriptional MerR regulator